MRAKGKLWATLGLLALLTVALAAPAGAQAAFGVKSLSVTALNKNGTTDLRAGSHPYEYIVSFVMNQDSEGHPEGILRDLIVDLPAGMVGNPQAIPRCSGAQFEGQNPHCPGNTQIGSVSVKVRGIEQVGTFPIYNLTPPLGVAASLGTSIFGFSSVQEASLRPGDYGARVSDITIPTSLEIQSASVKIWGVPTEPGHDSERVCVLANGEFKEVCPSESTPDAFLTLPTSCTGPLKTTISVASVQEPANPASKAVESLGEAKTPEGLSGCDQPRFEPTIKAQPETTAADSPTGLDFSLKVPQATLPKSGDPEGTATATAHLKDTTVALPAGLALNASTADGLAACSLAQIDLGTNSHPQCPAASKVGTVVVKTPLLDHTLPGSVYIARQGENPFGSLLALYVVVDDPISGVLVKLAGKVEPDPLSGQLRTSFRQNPQLPFEEFSFHFFGGPRAALTTPPACGTYSTTAELVPWTSPVGVTAFRSDSFVVNAGANGGPCPASEAAAPNAPALAAGTVTPIAGSYSPFVFKLTRENGSQRIAAIDATLPKGLTGKLAGIPYCSEPQIAAANARSGLGQGALEQVSPSCPLASEVGTATVGAGSGAPFYVSGRAYLAGPYKGAPLSLVIITPAVAGPFDLGVVVVRSALYVNETTAQIRAVSDPIPSILDGIPLDVRSIVLNMSRPDFTLNPTNCNPMSILGQATSLAGQVAPLSTRFQVGACGALGFNPGFAISLKGGTKRSQHPKLKAVITYPKGDYANIAKASVTLPRSEFIDPARVANPCTRPQFAEGKCPKGSVLGTAKAFSPLLDAPLTGKVYFRANGGERELPDLVIDLNGQVHFVLVGFVDAVVKKGTEISRIRNTFANAPDAPVSKFVVELKGGKEGLLVNSESLCAKTRRATVKMSAQNGKTHNSEPAIATSCK